MIQPLEKTDWQFLVKLNTHPPNDPPLLLLGVYCRDVKTSNRTKTYNQVSAEDLLMLRKHWKQFRCSSIGKGTNKLWCIYAMEYYHSTIKKKKLWIHSKAKPDPMGITPSERRESRKIMHYMVPLTWHSGNCKAERHTENRSAQRPVSAHQRAARGNSLGVLELFPISFVVLIHKNLCMC